MIKKLSSQFNIIWILLKFYKYKLMSRITEELLRKRSEHNEGRLTNLEEISLH